MGNDGTSFGGDFGDITLIKTGGTAGHASNDGEQTLTGTIAITDTSGSDGAGYLDIKGGTLILAPNGNSQSFEYITGAGNLDLVNTGGQTVELGLLPQPLLKLCRARLNCPVPERPRQSRYPVERRAETTTTSKSFPAKLQAVKP